MDIWVSLPRHKEGTAWCWPLTALSKHAVVPWLLYMPLWWGAELCTGITLFLTTRTSLEKQQFTITINFVLHTGIQNKYHIKLGILLVLTSHHSPYFCTDCTHTSPQKYYLPVHCATPLLKKRQSAFQNYILCLNTELTQPHQKRSSDSRVSQNFKSSVFWNLLFPAANRNNALKKKGGAYKCKKVYFCISVSFIVILNCTFQSTYICIIKIREAMKFIKHV